MRDPNQQKKTTLCPLAKMSRPNEGDWSESNTSHFLDILLECKRAADGLYNGKSVSDDFLDHVVHEMIVRTRTAYEKDQVSEKYKKMKADWVAFRTLIETTGVGWNPAENTIDIPPQKRKELEVSKSKKRIRNRAKALKPVPVIIRCRACGRVKLPHYFCCSGIKLNPGGDS